MSIKLKIIKNNDVIKIKFEIILVDFKKNKILMFIAKAKLKTAKNFLKKEILLLTHLNSGPILISIRNIITKGISLYCKMEAL